MRQPPLGGPSHSRDTGRAQSKLEVVLRVESIHRPRGSRGLTCRAKNHMTDRWLKGFRHQDQLMIQEARQFDQRRDSRVMASFNTSNLGLPHGGPVGEFSLAFAAVPPDRAQRGRESSKCGRLRRWSVVCHDDNHIYLMFGPAASDICDGHLGGHAQHRSDAVRDPAKFFETRPGSQGHARIRPHMIFRTPGITLHGVLPRS